MIDPQLFLQIDTGIPLRLSPKTFINRDDEDYFVIGLFDQDNARKFVKHLIACVYAFCNFVSPEDILMMWPEETANDLLTMIINLRKNDILVTIEECEKIEEELRTSTTPEEQELIKDKVWIEKHIKAFETIPQTAFVLNQGAKGSGTLAIELAKRNINKIVAINSDFQNTRVARAKAKEANLDNVEFIFCKPSNISTICYAEKFNVLFTEMFCTGIFEERVLESVIYAKKYLLSSDCQFIPAKFDLKVFAYQTNLHRDMLQESREFEILYGFKFGSFTKALSRHIMGIYSRLEEKDIIKLSEDQIIKTFDFKTLKEETFQQEFEITISKAGKVCGFCTYFDLHLTEDIRVSNSPYDEKNRFMQRIFIPAASIYLEAGEKIKLNASYDGNYRVLFAD